MGLREYRRKRDFSRTSEPTGEEPGGAKPAGKPKPGRSKAGRAKKGLLYVVQKHDATRLHYDFRLESDGVLKSWAVPKGPSLDPGERRLAVEVEDHPLEYGSFEGVIPEGEYGGGTVALWDRGTWEPEGDAREGLRKGNLKFRLDGEKLAGRWVLVRMPRRDDEKKDNWLLIKEKDEEARPRRQGDILKERPESVATGRSLPEIAAEAVERGEVWSSAGPPEPKQARSRGTAGRKTAAPRKAAAPPKAEKPAPRRKSSKRGSRPAPEFVPPQLATLVSETPTGEEWLFEIKLDGYRLEAAIGDGNATLFTRSGKDWTAKFPGIAGELAALPAESALLDGEVVALDAGGLSSFQTLQNALDPLKKPGKGANLVYFVFDLLHLDGQDLRDRPLRERKRLLQKLLPPAPSGLIRYNDHIGEKGADFYAQACRLGLEGILAKRADSSYRSGRGLDWVKVKCGRRQEAVIAGYTAPKGSRTDLGALLLGVYEGGELRDAGRVGTGFDAATLRDLRRRLEPLRRKTSPFVDPPAGAEARGVTWVQPKLVAEVAFSEWTEDGHLRHPSFQGLREDKAATEVRREEPAPPAAVKASGRGKAAAAKPEKRPSSRKGEAIEAIDTVAGVHLTHPDRVLYAEQGLTKADLATYYEAVADWMLPHLSGRPLSLVRCPQGSGKTCFFQKHLREGAPDAVHAVSIEEEDGAKEPYPYVDDVAGIVSLVQIGVLEFHVWGSRVDKVEQPDRLVFDLDPDPSVPWKQVVQAARLLRERLGELGLESFVQTTGGKGLHVVVPLTPRRTWEEVKPFARAFAASVVALDPDRYLSKASKAARKGKIFIDWLRNGRGATAIAPYSTRARAGATVATPVSWDELDRIQPTDFTVETVPGRLKALRTDPWAGFTKVRQSLRAEVLRRLKPAPGATGA